MQDHYSGLPEGTKTLFGKAVDYGKFRGKAGIDHSSQTPLSGGQMQRLAVYVSGEYSALDSEICTHLFCLDHVLSCERYLTSQKWACFYLTNQVHRSIPVLNMVSVPWFRLTICVESSCCCTDLFERLRNLRGSKTMIFSSHRFGNLTRHADLIL